MTAAARVTGTAAAELPALIVRAVGTVVMPEKLSTKRAEQVQQMVEECDAFTRHGGPVPEDIYQRWRPTLLAAAAALPRTGARTKGDIALGYIDAKIAEGARMTSKLIAEAARHAECTTETVRDWLQRERPELWACLKPRKSKK